MSEKKNYPRLFNGGMDSDTANEFIDPNKIRYALNCITSSTSEGEEGVVVNPLGNIEISIELPMGINQTIGSVSDEKNNRFIYAVWNSNNLHTWYMYDSVSNSISVLFQNLTDTKDFSIINWNRTDLILGINIVDGDKLYWTVFGSDQPAGKINIPKMISRQSKGYTDVIDRSMVLAFKRPPEFAPTASYFTNSSVKSNNLYRNLFKFVCRFYYDDFEASTFSDFSNVPTPDYEDITGTKGVPLTNNGIKVLVPTGGPLVTKIEVAMKKTNPDVKSDFSETDWVVLVVLDKEDLDIPDNSEYEYLFYNDYSYLSTNQEDVIQPYSALPDYPKSQEYSGNVLFYSNFKSGNPIVKTDIDLSVSYEDLFVPDSAEDVLNKPSFTYNIIRDYREGGGGGIFTKSWYHREGEVIIGSDVKSGNIFTMTVNRSRQDKTFTKIAGLNDDAFTIAAFFQGRIYAMGGADGDPGSNQGYTGNVVAAGGGSAKFTFRMWNNAGLPYITVRTSVTPVNYSKLKDNGSSVRNEKLGSAFRYGIEYEAVDTGKKSLVFVNSENLVSISNLSDLGDIKKVSTYMTINHKAPYWASKWQVVRTKNLVKSSYIDILIQSKATIKDSNSDELYQDLSIGSLFTYQQIYDASIGFNFEKGDRIRFLKSYSKTSKSWTVATNVIDYDVINYYPIVDTEINANIEIDGTSTVIVGDSPDKNNIGSYLKVNDSERLIIDVTTNGYLLELSFKEEVENVNSKRTYPSYRIINKRGVLRIKENPDYPINIVNGETYGLVEVFKASQNFTSLENEEYFEIGYKFDIIQDGENFYHRGNQSDQTDSGPAIVRIDGFDNYVRFRQLPLNNTVKNTQMIFTSIEDSSYSDFYVSNLSSYGRVNRLDDARGITDFSESIIPSQNRVEGTTVNGLSMFRNINRIDFNDKYGSIQRLMYHESILYILKARSTNYVPVRATIITDTAGQNNILAGSDNIIPSRLESVGWEDGVGNNPESAFRWGHNIFLVCPNTGVVLSIQGGSSEVVSTPLKFDKEIRDHVSRAALFGANILGQFDPYLKMCVWNVKGYSNLVFNSPWFSSNSGPEVINHSGAWSIISNPDNGIASIDGDSLIYSPDANFSGMDYMSYSSINNIIRNICVNVVSSEVRLIWIPEGRYCIMVGESRTGYAAYSILQQFDTISNSYTGINKPNVEGDPDYVAPVEDLVFCKIGIDSVEIGVINRVINTQSISVSVDVLLPASDDRDYNIVIKDSNSFDSGATIVETGFVKSGSITELVIPQKNNGYAYVFIVMPNGLYSDVKSVKCYGAYFSSVNFNSLQGLEEINLNQEIIPVSHGNSFSSISISRCVNLKKLVVIGHNVTSIDLTPNNRLIDVNLSKGYNLSNLSIGSWYDLRNLDISECLFTSDSYVTTFIDMVIRTFNSVVPNNSVGYSLKYGANNSLGVRPSSSVKIDYDRLLSKDVSVIGRAPVVTAYVDLSLDFEGIGQGVIVTCYLTNVLSTDITVTFNGSYIGVDDQVIYPIFDSMVINAGMLSGTKRVNFIMNGTDIGIAVSRVEPNPANGVIVNFN